MTNQNWDVGSSVDVGFVKGLTVVDKLPDNEYLLSKHGVFYSFRPYQGLSKLSEEDLASYGSSLATGAQRESLKALDITPQQWFRMTHQQTPLPAPGSQTGFPTPLSAPAPKLSPKQTPQPGFPAPLSTASSAMHVMPRIQPWSPPQQAGFPAPLAAPQSPATAMALSNIPGFPSATTPTSPQGMQGGIAQGGSPLDHIVSRLWMVIELLEQIRDNTKGGPTATPVKSGPRSVRSRAGSWSSAGAAGRAVAGMFDLAGSIVKGPG